MEFIRARYVTNLCTRSFTNLAIVALIIVGCLNLAAITSTKGSGGSEGSGGGIGQVTTAECDARVAAEIGKFKSEVDRVAGQKTQAAQLNAKESAQSRTTAAELAKAARLASWGVASVRGELMTNSMWALRRLDILADKFAQRQLKQLMILEAKTDRTILKPLIRARLSKYKAVPQVNPKTKDFGLVTNMIDKVRTHAADIFEACDEVLESFMQYVQDQVDLVPPVLETCTARSTTKVMLGQSGKQVDICTIRSADFHPEPWILFGDITSPKGPFTEESFANSPTNSGMRKGKSGQVGTFSAGEPGQVGYSLDVQELIHLSGSSDATFDLMIQFGHGRVFAVYFTGFQKSGRFFINNEGAKHSASRPFLGENGMWGRKDFSPNGFYATFCAFKGACAAAGNSFWTFSKLGSHPSTPGSVICGFYLGGWKKCPDGDNKQRMRYYIRFHPESESYELIGGGICIDSQGMRYNTFRRGGRVNSTMRQCMDGCSLYHERQCKGFEYAIFEGFGLCQLKMDAGVVIQFGGWSLTTGGGGRGEIQQAVHEINPVLESSVACYGRRPSRKREAASSSTTSPGKLGIPGKTADSTKVVELPRWVKRGSGAAEGSGSAEGAQVAQSPRWPKGGSDTAEGSGSAEGAQAPKEPDIAESKDSAESDGVKTPGLPAEPAQQAEALQIAKEPAAELEDQLAGIGEWTAERLAAVKVEDTAADVQTPQAESMAAAVASTAAAAGANDTADEH